MLRSKPIQKVDIVGPLELDPHEAAGEYLESKKQNEFIVKPPKAESVGDDSIELMYIQNERELKHMLELQKEMFREIRRQETIDQTRIRKLYKIQAKLKKRFEDVNNFLKDCAEKRRSAERKVKEELELHAKLEKDIKNYQVCIEDLSEFRKIFKETVEEFAPYEQVMKDVAEKSDMYESVKDCMDRCDDLMLAQVEITRKDEQTILEIEEMRKRVLKVTNDAAMTVLGMMNELAEMERCYIMARTECLKWARYLENAKDCVARNELNRDRSFDGINNMYRMFCKRRNIEPIYEAFRDVEQQLDFIKDEVEILTVVEREVLRQTADTSKGLHFQRPVTDLC